MSLPAPCGNQYPVDWTLVSTLLGVADRHDTAIDPELVSPAALLEMVLGHS